MMKNLEKLKNTKLRIILILLLVMILLFGAYFNTSVFFSKPESYQFKVFYSENSANKIPVNVTIGNEKQESYAVGQKYSIKSARVVINNPAESTQGKMDIEFQNFTKQVEFWYLSDSKTGEYTYNESARIEYEASHTPDFLISSQIFSTPVAIWLNTWESYPFHEGPLRPLLNRTTYDTWEGEIYLNSEFKGTNIDNITFLPATIEQLILEVHIPKSYSLESISGAQETQDAYDYIITKSLAPGESLHVIIKDKEKQRIKTIFNWIASLISIPDLLGLLLPATAKLLQKKPF